MPSQFFNLSKPEAASSESLPIYQQRNAMPPAYGHAKKLSTIHEEEREDELTAGPYYAWEIKRWLALEYATMIPQALLVDASSTLCAYLYLTSLRARMLLQQQVLLQTLQGVCGVVSQGGNTGVLSACSQALAYQQNMQSTVIPAELSHNAVIFTVIMKALFGVAVLKFASKYIRPFDYLVASGAAHCLLLYCFFFLPIAVSLSPEVGMTYLSPIGQKLFWASIISSAFLVMHRGLAYFFVEEKQAIALPTDSKSTSEKVEDAAV